MVGVKTAAPDGSQDRDLLSTGSCLPLLRSVAFLVVLAARGKFNVSPASPGWLADWPCPVHTQLGFLSSSFSFCILIRPCTLGL